MKCINILLSLTSQVFRYTLHKLGQDSSPYYNTRQYDTNTLAPLPPTDRESGGQNI